MAAPVRTPAQPQVALVTPTRKRRRWSTGHVVMIVAGLLGAVLTLLALRAADNRVAVSVASADLPAGARIASTSFTTKQLRIDSALRATLVTPADIATLDGSIVLTPVKAGEPVLKAALVKSAASDGRRSLSLPIAPERAVAGKLRNGDRVDVYTSGNKGGLITTNVEVLDVIRAESGPLSAKDSMTVVLAVDAEQASKLAPVVGSSDIVLVQATGAGPASNARPAGPTLTPLPAGTPVAPAPTPGATPGG